MPPAQSRRPRGRSPRWWRRGPGAGVVVWLSRFLRGALAHLAYRACLFTKLSSLGGITQRRWFWSRAADLEVMPFGLLGWGGPPGPRGSPWTRYSLEDQALALPATGRR